MACAVPLNHLLPALSVYGCKIVVLASRPSNPQLAPLPMCLFNNNGWYWVIIPIFLTPELAQLLNVKSIILYRPPKDTAGLAWLLVNLPNLVPFPPAKIKPNILVLIACSPLFLFSSSSFDMNFSWFQNHCTKTR